MNEFDLDANIDDFDADDDNVEQLDNMNSEYNPEDEDYTRFIKTVSVNAGSLTTASEKEIEILNTLAKLNENTFDGVFLAPTDDENKDIHDEDITVKTETKEQEKNEKTRKIFIKTKEWVVDCVNEGVNSLKRISQNKERIRVYDKKVEMPKIAFKKATEQTNPLPKVFLFLAACCVAGGFLGYMANSYYVYKQGNVTSTLSCAFSWMMQDNMPYTIIPFHSDVFWTAFLCGFGILCIIALFIWLDSETKKNSRIGHEHGKARLGKPSDFKNYKKKFME